MPEAVRAPGLCPGLPLHASNQREGIWEFRGTENALLDLSTRQGQAPAGMKPEVAF